MKSMIAYRQIPQLNQKECERAFDGGKKGPVTRMFGLFLVCKC
jgi:hypothetical protein